MNRQTDRGVGSVTLDPKSSCIDFMLVANEVVLLRHKSAQHTCTSLVLLWRYKCSSEKVCWYMDYLTSIDTLPPQYCSTTL